MTLPEQRRLPATSDALLAEMTALHVKDIDLSLERTYRLLDVLGDPHRRLPPVIHIAGTNGKGSTLATLRAGLQGAGLKVHTYTSPHLVRFHERIELANETVSEPQLVDLLQRVLIANDGGPATYFEATTCAAFLGYAEVPADALLLEVGLGGRMDTTNVVDTPRLTMITPVALDHQSFLGDTVAEIAAEKAGILKRGVPCIVSRQETVAEEVIEAHAARLGAPLHVEGQHWHVWEEQGRLVFQDETGLLDLPRPRLAGPHQIHNAGAAIAALRVLGHDEAACEAAVTGARWPARMQRLADGPLQNLLPSGELWLDGGHNPHAARAMAETLRNLPNDGRPLHLVFALQGGRDPHAVLAPFAGTAEQLTAVPVPEMGASQPTEEIVSAARAHGIAARAASDVREALLRIGADTPRARVLIFGSLYLAGAVLRLQEGAGA
ncbi:MAG: folylpolyglutamate synthase/dihydrofolate synthase family protein [Pseudomonadota bacterium]